jgi:hypothetical protein
MKLLDTQGIIGSLLMYSMMFAMLGSAALALIYCWRKGQLDMHEDPKFQMLEDEERGKR